MNADDSSPRCVTCLNSDWLYRDGVVGNAHERFLDDRAWQTVQIPHDAAIGRAFDYEKATSGNGWIPFGTGAYRKHFQLPAAAAGQRVLVEFEGVYRDAQVWINGHYLGRHLNGYIGFEHDLTEHAVCGGENVLAVTYDNRKQGTSRWYTGEGIYRDVRLKLVDPLHVPLYGTYVTTPLVTPAAARVKLETEVVNLHAQRRMCRLVTTLLGPDGAVAVTAEALAPVAAGERYTFHQELDVATPALWDLDAPNLYTAVSTLRVGDGAVDRYTTRFGIREVRMTPERGLLLNGRKVVAKGGDLHHDLGCLGSAEPVVHIMVEEADPAQWERFNNSGTDRWAWYPMVDHWRWGDRKQAKLMTFTNAEEVELLLNGKSLGRQKLADCRGRIMSWEVAYAPGTLKGIARNGGKIVAEHALTTPGEPVALRLTPHKPALAADGLDVVCVEAAVVDANGALVPVSNTPVTFKVDGPGANAGVASGNAVSDERWQGDTRSTWNGRCILLVRAARASGEIVVAATAPDLPQSQCRIAAIADRCSA